MQIVRKWLGWMTTLSLLSLTGCGLLDARKGGDFCDQYTVIDMPRSEAEKIGQPYRTRILANERYQFDNCPKR